MIRKDTFFPFDSSVFTISSSKSLKRLSLLVLSLSSLLIVGTIVSVYAFETMNTGITGSAINPSSAGFPLNLLSYYATFNTPVYEVHQGITDEALSFLYPDVLREINWGHEVADFISANQDDPTFHFDSCNFEETTKKINERYDVVLSLISLPTLNINNPDLTGSRGAFEKFGEILHTAADFYSHSNWVELMDGGIVPADKLIDDGRGYWTVLYNGDLISGTDQKVKVIEAFDGSADESLFRATGSHIVNTIHNGKVENFPDGLISGVADPTENPLSFGNCPNNIALGHWDPYYWISPFYPFGYKGNPERILGNIGTLHDTVGQVVLRNYRNDAHGNPIPRDYRGPIQMSDTQSGLNKDDHSREGYWDARALAVKQTTNEWCRLWNLVETQKGHATAEKLFSIMVQDKARAYQVCGKSLPVANAGSDQTVNAGTQVTLDGSKSSDGGSNAPLTYTWKLDSVTSSGGGGGGKFGGVISSILKSIQGSTPDPKFYTPPLEDNSPASSGTTPEEDLKFQLTVSDGVVDSDPSYVTIHEDGIPSGEDFVVNTNAMDTQPCSDSHCSLLEAITEANAHPGRDTIEFNLPSDQLVIPAIGLPEITDPVIIDGTTQVGAFYASKPIVEINGQGTQNGLVISAGNSIIKGLLIDNYGYGIVLKGSQQKTQTDSNTYTYSTTPTGGNVIEGNYIGSGMDSSTSSGTGNGIGIEIEASNNNQIGGLTLSERNIISGNTIAGIRVIDGVKTQVVQFNTPSEGQFTVTDTGCDIQCASSSNLIQGNYVGTDSTGKSAVPNGLYGIAILRSHDNIIGGIDQTARNIISGNSKDGIIISGDISTNNLVEGNYIGVDVDGTNKLPNTEMGVRLTSIIPQTASGVWQTSSGSTTYLGTPALNNIGNPAQSGAQNVISGNGQDGVYIGENALVNQVDGNFIGTDPTGKNAIGNSQNGVAIVGAVGNFIGGLNTNTPLSSIASYDSQNKIYTLNLLAGGFGSGQVHNVISGNGQNGVYINFDSIERDQNGNPVKDSNGNDIKKYVFAIFPSSTSTTTTTGSSSGGGGTATDRVFVANNFVRGNYIGTDVSGTSDLGNTADGVAIVDSSKNMVTTPTTSDPTPSIADPNVISFNKGNGVSVVSTTPGSATSNNIVGNDILNNGKLGIDLGNDGVTQNHDISNGVDSGVGGPNDFMNYPSGIVFYNSKYNQTIISGKLDATNPSSAEIEVYANKEVNPSGYGEGERLLGYITPNETTGSFIAALGKGNILTSPYNDIFGSKFNDDTSGGNLFPIITATATKNNSTSEFSQEFKHVIPPIANAGHYQRTAGGQIVTLNGTNSTASPLQPGANITSYSWQQIGQQQQQNGTSLSVLLRGSNTATPTFVAPNVTSPAVLYFRLTVTDSNGATDYDTVPVLVTKASQTPDNCSDNDNDWICNEVDTKPYSFSNDFSDIPLGGTTNGTVVDRGSQLFTIKEEPNPNGVRITDFSQAPGATDISNIIHAQPQPANFVGCGGAIQFYLHTGDEVILTCGSADLQVIKQNASNPQPILITYHTKDGITASTSLDAGNKLIFDPITSGITAPSNNSHGIDIYTQTKTFILQPGETVYLSHLPIVNTIITSAKDVKGLPITNRSSTNSSTITFNFTGDISSTSNDQIAGFDCFLNKDNIDGSNSSLVSTIPHCFNTLRFTDIPTGNYTFSVRGYDTHFITGPFANFTWTVNNNSSNATAGPKTITIDPLVANAGSTQTVVPGQKVTLQGNKSSSSTNNLTADNQQLFPDYKVSYLWKQIAGPSVMLNGSDTTNPSFIAPILNNTESNTTLSFELTVSDSIRQVASDRVSILVNATGDNNSGNNPHHLKAIAGPDQTISAASDTLSLTANGTVDSPFHIVSYKWTQVGGPSLALFSQKSNDYIYTRGDPASVYYQSSLGILQPFNGSPITTTINEFPILDNNSKFTFKLTVVDDTGLNASSTVNVNYVVSPNTHHLLANGGPDQTIFANMSNPNLSFFNRFNLNDYGSSVDNSPPPTQISRSQWLQIDGPPVSLEFDYACAYCFFGQGDTPVPVTLPSILDNNTKFTFKYSVADDQGEVSSVIKNVYYNITKNTHHLVASTKNTLKYVSEDLDSIPLNANASTVDPPANIVGYQWTQLSGPAVQSDSSHVVSLSAYPTTEVFTDLPLSSFANNTKLTFKLTVLDDQGEISSDTVDVHLVKSSTITANAGPNQIVVTEGQPVTLNGTYNDSALSAGAHIILTNWYRVIDNSSSSIRIPKLHPLDSTTGLVSTTPTLNFTAPFVQNDTTLKFRFFVVDSAGRSANSNVISVLVKNNATRTIDPPIADAGIYKNAFTEGSIVHLDGTNSYDPQNSSLTYSWKQLASQSGVLPSYYHLDIQNSNTTTPSFEVPYLPTNASDYTITTADGHTLSYVIFKIQLKVTNAAGNSSTDTARIDVLNTNHSPTVLSSGRVFSTESRNAFANVQLEGGDPDKDALSFLILQGPRHGTLHMSDGSNITTTTTSPESSSVTPTKITSAFNDSSISIAKIIYTPNKNYTGLDRFTYKANDGTLDSSNNGTAIINAADHAPVIPVNSNVINTVSYRDTNITLNAKDPDSSDALTYSILSNPSHGSIIKFDPHTGSLQYRPFGKYSPFDNFTFKANDGLLDSSIGTVTLHINASTVSFSKGDIIAAVGGQLRWYKSDGTFTGHYLFPAVPSKFTTDIAFDPSGSYLYAVQKDSKTITKFDKFGNSLGTFGSGWTNQSGPNSLAFDKQGNIYVGPSSSPFGSPLFLKFDPNGNLLKTYTNHGVWSEPNGVVYSSLGPLWIELAPDECTMYYSDNDFQIHRYNICTDTQLENFGGNTVLSFGNTVFGGYNIVSYGAAFGELNNAGIVCCTPDGVGPLRLLPNGTAVMFSISKNPGNGTLSNGLTPVNSTDASVTYTPKENFTGTDSFTYKANDEETLLLNQGSHIDRVNFTRLCLPVYRTSDNAFLGCDPTYASNSYQGHVIQTYKSTSPNSSWFTINLDPNCKSSFWAADVNNGIYKFDIPTGKLLQHINIQSPLQGFAVEKGSEGCNNASTNMTTSNLSPTIMTSQNKPVNITLNGVINGNNNSTVVNPNPITVKIDVNPFQNHPPIAVNAKASTNENAPVNINVLTNVTNPDHNPLSITAIPTAPKNGTAVINTNNNTITYTPSPHYFGVDSFAYKISDGQGDTSTANVFVTVKHLIVQPVANAGENQTVNENTTGVTLNGSKSYDRDGRIVSYLWSQIGGPNVTLNNSSAAVTTFTAPSVTNDTNLKFKLTVTDNDNATSSATTSVLVKNVNLAPIANAGTNQTVNENTTGVTLDGSHSIDRDGTIKSYSWTQTSGPSVSLTGANTSKATFKAPSVRVDTTLTFRLTVTDNDGASSAATTNVLVKRVNIPPIAVIVPANQTVNASRIVELDGSKSKDPDGGTLSSYSWIQTSGPTVTLSGADTAKTSFTAPNVTSDTPLTFKLTVKDNDNATSSATVTVLVKHVNHPPIANAGPDQIVNENATNVTLNGTASSDPDKNDTIASYSWKQVSGISIVTLTGANTATPSFTAPSVTADTNLKFNLTVTDNHGATSKPDTVSITIKNVNIPPMANAGTNQTVNENTTGVMLDGSKSFDKDGNIISYNWQQTAGPLVNLSDIHSVRPTFTTPSVANNTLLSFKLTVTDNDNATSSATTNLLVKNVNIRPMANAGVNQTVFDNASGFIILDGTNSHDPDGTIKSYHWAEMSGSDSPTVQLIGANTSKASFNMPHITRDATLTFELTVTDNDGAGSTSDTSVLIKHVNLPPIAVAGSNQTVNESKTVTLNGTKSSDPDGTIQSYIWTQSTGPKVNLTSANTATPSFVAPHVLANTTLTFNLKVTDNQGVNSTNPASTNVIVKHVNIPPIADIGLNQTVNGNTKVTLDGTRSSDPDGGDISSYQWVQTAGPTVTLTGANTATPAFTAPTSTTSDTTLTFKLIVTDSDGGATSSDSTSVLVKRTNIPPIANAGPDQTVNENTTGVILDGSKSADPDGGMIASYDWIQTSGPTVKLDGSNTATPTFTAPPVKTDTTLTFKLTVTDSDGGASSSATTNVIIKHVNIPPTAVIIPTNQTVNENTTNVILDGSASSDKDGTIKSYSWTQTSGPSVILTGGKTSKAAFTAPSVVKDTTLTFKLAVTDNDNATSSATTNILVKNVNIPPVANAGVNQTVDENTTGVTLSAIKSYDPDGKIVSYLWTQTSGPSVGLSNPNSVTTTFTAPSVTKDTSLTFSLTVKDDSGANSSATTSVLVKNVNLTPIANAGTNQTVNENTTGVKLDGTKSFDRDGTIAAYSWTQTAGPTVALTGANTPTPTFTAPSVTKDTTLTFKLTVTDNDGASSSSTTNVIVKNLNISPIANAGTNQTVNENTTGVKLDGSKSFDRDGTIISYNWQQTSGPSVVLSNPNSASTTFTAPSVTADTTLTFTLTVIDNNGASSSGSTSVLVKNVNIPPVANAGASQTVNEGTANVKLDGTKSYDPDKGDTIVSYSWTQTAGPTVTLTNANTATPTFTAPQVNADTTLTFSLKVTDNHGATSTNTATTSVLVKNVNQAPVAKAVVLPSTTVTGGTIVTLDGSGSSDPDGGTIASYQWVQTAGSPTITLQGANTAKATFTAPSNLTVSTTYTFKLTVTDNDGPPNLSASTAASVLVTAQANIHPGTIGYWKNHQAATTALLPVTLGNYIVNTWTKASSIFNSASASNAYEQLTAQLLATKLDIKNGSPSCTNINNAISQADTALINTGYKGPGTTKAPSGNAKNTITSLITTLDNYNNDGCSSSSSSTSISSMTTTTPTTTSPTTSSTTTATPQTQSSSSISPPISPSKTSTTSQTNNTASKASAQQQLTFNPALPPSISSPTSSGGVGGRPTANTSSSSNTGTSSISHTPAPALPPLSQSPSISPQTSSSTPAPYTTQITPKANPANIVSPNNNNNNGPSITSSAVQPASPSAQSQPQQQQPLQTPTPYQPLYPNKYPYSPSQQPSTTSPPSSTPRSLYPYQSQQQQPRPQPAPSGIQHVNQPPLANVGLSQTVYGGTIVTLDGRASYDPDNMAVGTSSYGTHVITNNGIAGYQWTQVQILSGSGLQTPIITLQGANTATPTFVVPVLPYDITLAFSLKVVDSDGGAVSSNPAMVYVMVKHNPIIGPTGSSSNIPGATIIQPQQQQPLLPNNNAISPPPLPSNSHPPSSSLPQTGLPAVHNQAVP